MGEVNIVCGVLFVCTRTVRGTLDATHTQPPVLLLTKPSELHTATSRPLRATIAAHPQLRDILRTIDGLHGREREEALERALGVAPGRALDKQYPDEATQALRQLAEAVEAAVRGSQKDALGLDWGD